MSVREDGYELFHTNMRHFGVESENFNTIAADSWRG
jgi:hypothetical protein